MIANFSSFVYNDRLEKPNVTTKYEIKFSQQAYTSKVIATANCDV